jgi:hypothetical protein
MHITNYRDPIRTDGLPATPEDYRDTAAMLRAIGKFSAAAYYSARAAALEKKTAP